MLVGWPAQSLTRLKAVAAAATSAAGYRRRIVALIAQSGRGGSSHLIRSVELQQLK
jgi:hypothetical protein